MTQALERAFDGARAWLSGLDTRPIEATIDPEALRHRLDLALPQQGEPPEQVIDELIAMTEGGLLGSASGRFFAWVIGGSLTSALAADWLVSTWDQNAALYACGPAAAVIEEVAGAWIKELLDLPSDASFAFTTGCQLAHFTGLAAARYAMLKRAGWDVEDDGLFGAPRLHVLVNEHKHGSVERAARYLGLGRRSIRTVATDAQGRITPRGLEVALDGVEGQPVVVVLNAADLNIGACDPFKELIPIAHAAQAWVHVDGAFGLIARSSRARRHLLDGVEHADSWATDGHKWLNVPFDCGIAIVRDSEAHKSAMTLSASYISASGARDQIDWNPEWSRRARGVPLYAALRELGREGVERLVDRSCDHCHALVSGLGALPGVVVVAAPTLNQGLVRFTRAGAGARRKRRLHRRNHP